MNFDLFSTVVAIWSGAVVLFGLGVVLLGELGAGMPPRRPLAPSDQPSNYKKAA